MSLLTRKILDDSSTISPVLRALIEQAYVVFAGRSVRIPFGVCKCNVYCNNEHEQVLVKVPFAA
jgi:hypothetical protein